MQGDSRFIRTLQLGNLLSFGPESPPIERGPLNVLIGPNGSGKSNLIKAIESASGIRYRFGCADTCGWGYGGVAVEGN